MKHSAYFERWYRFAFIWEGSKLNHVVKLEGEKFYTNLGITEQTYNSLAPRVLGVPQNDLARRFRNMTENEHKAIAKWFWDNSGAERFVDGRIAVFFTEQFWGGGRGAIQDFQAHYNQIKPSYKPKIAVDGFVGNQTATAFNALNQDELFKSLIAKAAARYPLMENYDKYGKGWENRLQSFTEVFSEFHQEQQQKKTVCACCGQPLP
ncbi:hypothetical protein [Hugenholtzia roseola]|uniref:hypothetical protein n=1 Tax=Hugenholtzia roseola TaxID=1002 RepID=UPI00047B0385|nr:hypothetical protein [Hugenholtzia roseola]